MCAQRAAKPFDVVWSRDAASATRSPTRLRSRTSGATFDHVLSIKRVRLSGRWRPRSAPSPWLPPSHALRHTHRDERGRLHQQTGCHQELIATPPPPAAVRCVHVSGRANMRVVRSDTYMDRFWNGAAPAALRRERTGLHWRAKPPIRSSRRAGPAHH